MTTLERLEYAIPGAVPVLAAGTVALMLVVTILALVIRRLARPAQRAPSRWAEFGIGLAVLLPIGAYVLQLRHASLTFRQVTAGAVPHTMPDFLMIALSEMTTLSLVLLVVLSVVLFFASVALGLTWARRQRWQSAQPGAVGSPRGWPTVLLASLTGAALSGLTIKLALAVWRLTQVVAGVTGIDPSQKAAILGTPWRAQLGPVTLIGLSLVTTLLGLQVWYAARVRPSSPTRRTDWVATALLAALAMLALAAARPYATARHLGLPDRGRPRCVSAYSETIGNERPWQTRHQVVVLSKHLLLDGFDRVPLEEAPMRLRVLYNNQRVSDPGVEPRLVVCGQPKAAAKRVARQAGYRRVQFVQTRVARRITLPGFGVLYLHESGGTTFRL